MNATRAKNLIVGVFSDLQVNPTILASFIYGSMKDDVMVRFHDFMLELISLWAGPNNESEKTAHIYRWARNVNPYKEG
jgi:hypothetical protein